MQPRSGKAHRQTTWWATQMRRSTLESCLLGFLMLFAGDLFGERVPNGWQLLAVAYPPDRDVSVSLGGAEKTLNSRGICKVKWRKDAATLELELENLPLPAELGWTGQQYILWAIDSEKRTLNLGLVPLHGKEAKWKLQVPFRVFGLLVTAEKNAQTQTPSSAVVLESLLPTDPSLVVPVFRVNLTLAPSSN